MGSYVDFPDLDIYESEEDSRGRIINSAIYHFAKEGFSDTKTKDIAATAGVSEALVFKYFCNKKRLLDQVSTEIVENRLPRILAHRLEEQMASGKPFSKEEFLAFLRGKFEYITANIGYFRILFLEMGYNSENTIQKIKGTVEGFYGQVEAMIVILQEKGIFRDELPPRTIFRCFAASLNFLMLDRKVFQTPLNTDEELEAILSIFMNGVMIHDR